MKLEGKAKMLRIHFGEDDKWKGHPLYQAIVERCRDSISRARPCCAASKVMAPAPSFAGGTC